MKPATIFGWLACCLLPLCARAEDWVDGRQADPFVLRANYRLEQDAELFTQLQDLQVEIAQLLAVERAAEPVELFLFRDEASYGRYLAARFPGVPARRAMYVKHTGPGMVFAYQSRDFAVDLRHETTHALLHAVLPSVPLWLDEGLAEYFELPTEARAFDNHYAASLTWRIRLGQVQSLAALESKRELSEMGRNEYRDAWAWVHFMLHGPDGARDELRKYLSDLKQTAHAEPLSRRLERRLPGLEKRLLTHFKTWQRPE
ncbi:MAG: hypothetical protein AB7O62_25945 [Pirellulales bacterium]